jgi:O-antigen/teichoic acid export membrane protein
VTALLKRLVASGAAYQASSVLSAVLAIVTLPLYTRHLTPAEYGYAETLLTFIIFSSIVLRAGVGEAFVRLYFDDEDPARRDHLARTATLFVAVTTTIAAAVCAVFAEPMSRLLLGRSDTELMDLGLLGLWAFTNLELAYALLRVDERRRVYVVASCANVVLTVVMTVVLVVFLDEGARGYVLGNYGSSAVVLLGLWWTLRHRVGVLRPPQWSNRTLRSMLAFGAPTVPADTTTYALNVVDRAYLLHAQSAGAAGLYAIAVKLSSAVIVAVRGFQAAWPPLAYSVTDDAQAKHLYARVTTYYVLFTGVVVMGITLLGRWLVRLLAAPDFFAAHTVLPWVALGWAMYGLVLVQVTIAGRAKVTARTFPGSVAGLGVNVVVLILLTDQLGIDAAGIALVSAYVVMVSAIHLLTRRAFAVPFEWGRLSLVVGVLGGAAIAGEVLLPTGGWAGFLSRAAVAVAAPCALLAAGFLAHDERAGLRALSAQLRARVRRSGDVDAEGSDLPT